MKCPNPVCGARLTIEVPELATVRAALEECIALLESLAVGDAREAVLDQVTEARAALAAYEAAKK
jgi:hypothetical protein